MIELAIVIGVLLMLGLLALPLLGQSQADSRRAVCRENVRRLNLAWQMHADEHDGVLVANAFYEEMRAGNWVMGVLDYSTKPGNTNLETLRDGSLFRYVKDVRAYHCPSDPSGVGSPGGWVSRTRSYSLNGWLGENASGWPPEPAPYTDPNVTVMKRLDEIADPRGTFVFLDEHPDSINDGAFMVDVAGSRRETRIVDFPGHHHRGAAHLGFADGSVQLWQWRDPRTLVPIQFTSMQLNVLSPGNDDIERLVEVTTHPR